MKVASCFLYDGSGADRKGTELSHRKGLALDGQVPATVERTSER